MQKIKNYIIISVNYRCKENQPLLTYHLRMHRIRRFVIQYFCSAKMLILLYLFFF